MQKIMLTVMCTLLLTMLVCPLAAEENVESKGENRPPHEHGSAVLQLILKENQLQIKFWMTGWDAIGFENEPTIDEEVEAVDNELVTLKKPQYLFLLPVSAECETRDITVSYDVLADEPGHTEFYITSQYECQQVANLSEINAVPLFLHYPGLVRVKTIAVLPERDLLATITEKTPRLKLQ